MLWTTPGKQWEWWTVLPIGEPPPSVVPPLLCTRCLLWTPLQLYCTPSYSLGMVRVGSAPGIARSVRRPWGSSICLPGVLPTVPSILGYIGSCATRWLSEYYSTSTKDLESTLLMYRNFRMNPMNPIYLAFCYIGSCVVWNPFFLIQIASSTSYRSTHYSVPPTFHHKITRRWISSRCREPQREWESPDVYGPELQQKKFLNGKYLLKFYIRNFANL